MDFFFNEEINKPLPFISYFEPSAITEEEHHPVTAAVEETPVGSSISFEEENKLEFKVEKTIGSMTSIGDEDISRVLPFLSSFELPAVSEDTTYFLPLENTIMVAAEETNAPPVHVQEIVLENRTAGITINIRADVERREKICVHHERKQRPRPIQVHVVRHSTPASFDECDRKGRNAYSGYVDNSSMTI